MPVLITWGTEILYYRLHYLCFLHLSHRAITSYWLGSKNSRCWSFGPLDLTWHSCCKPCQVYLEAMKNGAKYHLCSNMQFEFHGSYMICHLGIMSVISQALDLVQPPSAFFALAQGGAFNVGLITMHGQQVLWYPRWKHLLTIQAVIFLSICSLSVCLSIDRNSHCKQWSNFIKVRLKFRYQTFLAHWPLWFSCHIPYYV